MNDNSRVMRGLLVAICVLLGALLITSLWEVRQDVLERERRVYHQEQTEAIRVMVELQDELVLDLLDDYQDTAYGSSVDRIAEQQLIAAETQIMALQTIAMQNRQITELLLLPYTQPPNDADDEPIDGE